MSTILVDNLTGKTSAGDITVTSEGGAATQSLQQGLAKAWVLFQGTGTVAIDDSHNTASISDVGTGQYTVNFSASMNNAFYAGIGSAKQDTSGTHTSNVDRIMNPARVPLVTSNMKFHAQNLGGGDSDIEEGAVHIMGDLA
jgi:hypothetical protein